VALSPKLPAKHEKRFNFRPLTEVEKKVFMRAFDAKPRQLSKAAGKNSKLARLA